jgi:predicted negative regulator of RcsB-dependent stress response
VVRCQRLADTKLVPGSAALSADISYRLATIARQQYQLDEAIQLFGQCMAATFDVLKTDQHTAGAHAGKLLAARYLVAKCSALGIGYCFIEKGLLREARIAISTGEILLWETKDWRNLQYCELLFSRLLRHEAGRDPKNAKLLAQADAILQELVRKSADTLRKPRFTLRVRYELGFVDLYSGRFRAAETNFDRVVEAATTAKDGRWLANGLVALARLRLYQGKAANSDEEASRLLEESGRLAANAGSIARQAGHRWSEARCILMQARAEMALAALPIATEDEEADRCRSADSKLQKVLEMTDLANPAVRALPLILLARLRCSRGDLPQARQFFDRWTAISPQVQYTAIQALGKEVEREFFASGRGFVINATTSDEDLNLQRLSRDLERYMIERLQARSDLNDAQRAKFMGISRNTYHRHRKKLLGL